MADDRLPHELYRCKGCNNLLSKYQILRKWDAQTGDGGGSKGVCECGGGRISPSNPTPQEYAEYSRLKYLLLYVLGRRDHRTVLWEIVDRVGPEGGAEASRLEWLLLGRWK